MTNPFRPLFAGIRSVGEWIVSPPPIDIVAIRRELDAEFGTSPECLERDWRVVVDLLDMPPVPNYQAFKRLNSNHAPINLRSMNAPVFPIPGDDPFSPFVVIC